MGHLNRTAVSLTGHGLGAEFHRPVVDHVLANGAAPTTVEAERLAGLLGGPATH